MSGTSDGNSGVDRRAQQLYERAIGLPPSERETFLREQCAREPALRGRVESLLDAAAASTRTAALPTQDSQIDPPHHPRSRGTPTLDPTTAGRGEPLSASAEASAILSPGPPPTLSQIGHYKLLEVIGEGGFGTVWVADQTWPVRRRVALKIIKPGMDSKAVIARFEQERQALAIMEHPNIAKVLDAGTSPDGRPYFVMEYVPGEPITVYCDRNRLNIPQRLLLFTTVCEAVQHAHHKGIIHRDIKPSNVLVSVAPGSGPVVKVIDFGVAKAVSHNLTDKTLFTEHGQILGTPEYMSPEQAEMGALDIDTRTDVYALGVLLYEILTGALPFEPHDLRSRGYNEIQRIIREVDPPRPSVRLRSMGKISAEIAAKRQAKLDELEGQLRRELEWIPLKAMRKDRGERYPTPVALAEDIRNHLAGRPLVAGPESVAYRARKFIHRNKLAVAAASAVALALLIGAIVSTIGFVRAARNAEMYRVARDEAVAQRDRANEEAARQRLTNQFTTELLANANPAKGEPRDVTVQSLLENAVLQLDAGSLAAEPRVEAAVRGTLGLTFRSLSLWRAAELQLRKALELETNAAGADSPEAARALSWLGQVQLDMGQLREAEDSLSRALAIQRETLPPNHVQLADTTNLLGLLEMTNGEPRKAEQHFRDAMAIYQKQHPAEIGSLSDAATNLATVLHRMGNSGEALELTRGALDMRRQKYGHRSPHVWNSLTNLAALQESQNELAAAERTRRDALKLARDLFGERHRNTALSTSRLARTLWLRGTDAPLAEAQNLQTDGLEVAQAVDGERSATVAEGLDLQACIARDRGQTDRAVELFRQALSLRRDLVAPDHPDVAAAKSQLADALTRAGHPQEAIELARDALEIRKRVYGPEHWTTWNTTSVLGGALAAAGQFDQAEPLLLSAYRGLENGSALGWRPRLDAARRLEALYEKWAKPQESARWRARVVELQPPTTQP